MSYARVDKDYVDRVRSELLISGIDCWIDDTNIQTGDRLNSAIKDAISQSDLFFAYVTNDYLNSQWCMTEFRQALGASGVAVAPYVAQRVVPAVDHILAGPSIFDSVGYARLDLIEQTKMELILAGPNLRSWLSDDESKQGLVSLVQKRQLRVTLILATYETLRAVSPEGAIHLRASVNDIRQMLDLLDPRERRLMSVHFHVGASTLSAVIIDPKAADGLLFFSPRWAIQFLPQDRMTCVVDKKINSEGLFKAIYNGVLLMTQGDAKTIEEMSIGP